MCLADCWAGSATDWRARGRPSAGTAIATDPYRRQYDDRYDRRYDDRYDRRYYRYDDRPTYRYDDDYGYRSYRSDDTWIH